MRMRRWKITKAHVAEAVGSTAAECAAVFCCCPCGIAELVVLVAYRVPASLCKKAWRRRQRQLIRKTSRTGEGETRITEKEESVFVVAPRKKDEVAAGDRMEKEMWERFYDTGFWRSPSQREQILHEEIG